MHDRTTPHVHFPHVTDCKRHSSVSIACRCVCASLLHARCLGRCHQTCSVASREGRSRNNASCSNLDLELTCSIELSARVAQLHANVPLQSASDVYSLPSWLRPEQSNSAIRTASISTASKLLIRETKDHVKCQAKYAQVGIGAGCEPDEVKRASPFLPRPV